MEKIVTDTYDRILTLCILLRFQLIPGKLIVRSCSVPEQELVISSKLCFFPLLKSTILKVPFVKVQKETAGIFT